VPTSKGREREGRRECKWREREGEGKGVEGRGELAPQLGNLDPPVA